MASKTSNIKLLYDEGKKMLKVEQSNIATEKIEP